MIIIVNNTQWSKSFGKHTNLLDNIKVILPKKENLSDCLPVAQLVKHNPTSVEVMGSS